MKYRSVILVLAWLGASSTAAARQELTVERIWGSSEFASDLVPAQWMSDGAHFTALVASIKSQSRETTSRSIC